MTTVLVQLPYQDILDVNTLELARQMAITYSTLFRQLSVSQSVANNTTSIIISTG